jgi:hypothetical protein
MKSVMQQIDDLEKRIEKLERDMRRIKLGLIKPKR